MLEFWHGGMFRMIGMIWSRETRERDWFHGLKMTWMDEIREFIWQMTEAVLSPIQRLHV